MPVTSLNSASLLPELTPVPSSNEQVHHDVLADSAHPILVAMRPERDNMQHRRDASKAIAANLPTGRTHDTMRPPSKFNLALRGGVEALDTFTSMTGVTLDRTALPESSIHSATVALPPPPLTASVDIHSSSSVSTCTGNDSITSNDTHNAAATVTVPQAESPMVIPAPQSDDTLTRTGRLFSFAASARAVAHRAASMQQAHQAAVDPAPQVASTSAMITSTVSAAESSEPTQMPAPITLAAVDPSGKGHADQPNSAQAERIRRLQGAQHSGRDPDFLNRFFESSRLHFIGSWKKHYDDLVNSGVLYQGPPLYGDPPKSAATVASDRQGMRHSVSDSGASNALLMETSSARTASTPLMHTASSVPRSMQPGGAPAHAHNDHPRTIMHIDMDCFFASVAIRDNPALVDKPVAVSHSKSGGGAEISSCNYIARKFGCSAGTVQFVFNALNHLFLTRQIIHCRPQACGWPRPLSDAQIWW